MTTSKEDSPSNSLERQQQLRQLGHDVKTVLGVVTLGLQALEGVRDDPEAFAELRTTIEVEGVNPLKQLVAQIVAVALADQGSSEGA